MSSEGEERAGGFRFDRMELAGSLGDLGTLIPLTVGIIVYNGLSPTSVLLWIGLFYLLAGAYYRLPIPVQPLKVVAAVAIASPEKITEPVIAAAGISMGLILLALSLSGAMEFISRLFTRPVVRGIQLGLGLILMRKGFMLMGSQTLFVPGAANQPASGFQINLIIGVVVFIMILALLNNRRLPAAIVAVAAGIVTGLAFGGFSHLAFSLGPSDVSLVKPGLEEFGAALWLLVLPQIPLTIGNACIGTADTAHSLFPDSPDTARAKPSRFALTMGVINIPAGLMGAMPMCHGAGGLAAHYRFGARTGGSNLMIGAVFIILALALGKISLGLLTIMPNSILGVLLTFAGIELALLVRDVEDKASLFVSIMMAGLALASSNMAWAFLAGISADLIIRKMKVDV